VVVLYDGDRLLGGGTIAEALPAEAATGDASGAAVGALPGAVAIDTVRGAV